MYDVSVHGLLTKERMCDEVLGMCSKPDIQRIHLNHVVDRILADKPAEIQDDDFTNKLYKQIEKSRSERQTFRAVHLTDLHMDLEYKIGTKANCSDVMCCREESGYPEPGANATEFAGRWGSYKCDLPTDVLENSLDYIVNELKPDVIFWTGDNNPHDVWEESNESVANYTIVMTQIIKDKLKGTDIAVVPIHGNHDTWPVD